VHPAVSLGAAAACFLGSAYCYRRRDGVLRLMTRVRGHGRTANRRPDAWSPATSVDVATQRPPPGPRRRYQRGTSAAVDMLSPVVALLVVAVVLLVSGVLALR
jgi:hypothetical protein